MITIDHLRKMQADLLAVTGINTCRIGLEAGLSVDDYPMIRIVIDEISPSLDEYYDASARVAIHFGVPILESDENINMSDIYEQHLIMHNEIVSIVESSSYSYSGTWINTIPDSDDYIEYKVGTIFFDISIHC